MNNGQIADASTIQTHVAELTSLVHANSAEGHRLYDRFIASQAEVMRLKDSVRALSQENASLKEELKTTTENFESTKGEFSEFKKNAVEVSKFENQLISAASKFVSKVQFTSQYLNRIESEIQTLENLIYIQGQSGAMKYAAAKAVVSFDFDELDDNLQGVCSEVMDSKDNAVQILMEIARTLLPSEAANNCGDRMLSLTEDLPEIGDAQQKPESSAQKG